MIKQLPVALTVALATMCLLMSSVLTRGAGDGSTSSYTRVKLSNGAGATHSNFIKSQLYLRDVMKIHPRFHCGNDESFCGDPIRNPRGGSTCCFKRFCRDLDYDRSNCGRCGSSCGYGLSCCHGKCVNLFSNNKHCGSCGIVCEGRAECEFGLCGYGGYDSSTPEFFPKHW